jgi:conjugal transfer pilus assembly protein TraE
MDNDKHQEDLRAHKAVIRRQGTWITGLVLALIVCGLVILKIEGSDRTIFTPPAIEKSFWVSRDKVSREYLEQMAGFMAWLYLDLHPKNVDWKKGLLLAYVDPDDYDEMKKRMDLQGERLRRMSADTTFLTEQLVANEETLAVKLVGLERIRINGDGEPKPKAYCVQFRMTGSRMHLKGFKEIPYGQNTQAGIGAAAGGDSGCAV